jgi:hypothetical protein
MLLLYYVLAHWVTGKRMAIWTIIQRNLTTQNLHPKRRSICSTSLLRDQKCHGQYHNSNPWSRSEHRSLGKRARMYYPTHCEVCVIIQIATRVEIFQETCWFSRSYSGVYEKYFGGTDSLHLQVRWVSQALSVCCLLGLLLDSDYGGSNRT